MGPVTSPRAMIVARRPEDEEPTAFGDDAAAIWTILRTLPGWYCVNVDYPVAEALAALMQSALGREMRLYDDIYFTLQQPVAVAQHLAAAQAEAVTIRLLTSADRALLETAPEQELRGAGFGSVADLLSDGVVAGAIAEGKLVAIAHTYALSRRYADIGVYTRPDWRLRGLSSATAALVMAEVQAQGRIPTWSTGADNLASQRVALRLGLAEVGRRAYIIPEAEKAD